MALERVQKILAQAGIASRRKAEELIIEGSVTINGKVAKLGDKAEWGKDSIKVYGKLLNRVEPHVYLAFNKPKLVISAMRDPEGRPCLSDYLSEVPYRVYPVGRLDFMSEGLIILTNDGEIAEKLQKEGQFPRVYEVKTKGQPTKDILTRLQKGTRFEGKFIRPTSVRLLESLTSKSKIELVFQGPGSTELKPLFERNGLLIDRMVRTQLGQIMIEGIKPGEFRHLKKSQVEALIAQPELGLRTLKKEKEKAEDNEKRRSDRETKMAEREALKLKKQRPPLRRATSVATQKKYFMGETPVPTTTGRTAITPRSSRPLRSKSPIRAPRSNRAR